MLHKEARKAICEKNSFSKVYFEIHKFLYQQGVRQSSRNGETIEMLHFDTEIANPTRRCVGGYQRRMNIYFLLAEALWIFKGRRDVEFMDMFNSQLKNYSDNGKHYHAPYGWRLRKQGITSEGEVTDSNRHYFETGLDQVRSALVALKTNVESRRVVMQIWNAGLDMDTVTKDLPCNDIVMLKVRNGGLNLSIGNRSNDLDRGLTTNVFQFSMVGEIMAAILDLRYDKQVHHSDSLHLYTDFSVTDALEARIREEDNAFDFYEHVNPLKINFNFPQEQYANDREEMVRKLYWVDFFIHGIILKLTPSQVNRDLEDYESFSESLLEFCPYFFYTFKMLEIYVAFKSDRVAALKALVELGKKHNLQYYDFYILGLNWFLLPMNDAIKNSYIENLSLTFPNIDFRKMKIGYL